MSDCACVSSSATSCWAIRYNIDPMDVELDGGPCMCACHDGCDDDHEPDTDEIPRAVAYPAHPWVKRWLEAHSPREEST